MIIIIQSRYLYNNTLSTLYSTISMDMAWVSLYGQNWSVTWLEVTRDDNAKWLIRREWITVHAFTSLSRAPPSIQLLFYTVALPPPLSDTNNIATD